MGRAAEKVVMPELEVALWWRIVGRSGDGSWAEAVLDHAALPFIPGDGKNGTVDGGGVAVDWLDPEDISCDICPAKLVLVPSSAPFQSSPTPLLRLSIRLASSPSSTSCPHPRLDVPLP